MPEMATLNKHLFLALLYRLAVTGLATSFNRSSFHSGFIFGTATSAYQNEGGASQGGRGPSIWDTFAHKYPGKIADGSNGDVAVDSYHRYKEDVKIMKEMGLDAYRFSISWSRILPRGRVALGVNKEGIHYYDNLINELLGNGIQPFVTMFHWDLPQILEDKHGGFRSPRIVDDFLDYAELCFQSFGDRVKHWITLNEPLTYSVAGYVLGISAPGRCSDWQGLNCTGGDSAIEPYLVSHHQLLAHAAAVQLYREKFQASQKGSIGITLNIHWGIPYSDSMQDKNAALRFIDFMLGWFMEPLTVGDYPHTMRYLVGERLPKFTSEQSRLVKGSFDFVGLNYYTTYYIADAGHQDSKKRSYSTDSRTNTSTSRNGVPIGPQGGSSWLYVYPKGLKDLLLYMKKEYNDPFIYITENGVDEVNNPNLSLHEALVDLERIDYHYQHLQYLKEAILEGVNVNGYFAWSLLDNFEWGNGYTKRFGINFVDYKDGLTRYSKLSAHWFKSFLQKRSNGYNWTTQREIILSDPLTFPTRMKSGFNPGTLVS